MRPTAVIAISKLIAWTLHELLRKCAVPESRVLLPLHEEVHHQRDELLLAYRQLSADVFLGALHIVQKLEGLGRFELAKTDVRRTVARTVAKAVASAVTRAIV